MATTAVTINVFLTISVISHLPAALMATTTTLATTREIRTFMMVHFWLSWWFGCSFSTDTTEPWWPLPLYRHGKRGGCSGMKGARSG